MITITSYLGWSSRASASIVSPRTACSWRAGNSNENEEGAPAARRRKPVAASASGLRHACSIHHRVVLATVNNPSDRTTSTALRSNCGHDNGRFSLCAGGIGCACGSVSPENACTPWAGGSAPPDEPSRCAPGAGCPCSVGAEDPPPLAEGTDGCGAGWSWPPNGCPLRTTNATKRRTAPNATAVRLTRSPQRFASPTVTAWSAVSCCGRGRRGGAEGLTTALPSGAGLSTGRARRTTSPCVRSARYSAALFGRLDRRDRTDGLTGTVSGSSRAVVSTSRSSRVVVSTGPMRRTTSRQCARTASRGEASVSCLGPRSGTEARSGAVSRSSRVVGSTGPMRRTASRQCARTASCSEALIGGLGRRGRAEG
jgi:hypothetical protein